MDDFLKKPDFDLWPLFERSSDGVVLITAHPWRVAIANSIIAKWLATAPEQLTGRALDTLFDEGSIGFLHRKLEKISAEVPSDDFELLNLAPANGVSRPVAASFCRVGDKNSTFIGIVLRDRSAADVAASRLDPLTGLPDRAWLNSRLTKLLGRHRPTANFAVLFVDINNFKEVNDRHGHLVGDRVLREAARQLSNSLIAGSWPVRYGGDEFIVLVDVLVDAPATTEEVESLIAAVKAAMSRPIAVPGGVVTLAVSVGMAIGPAEFCAPEDVIAAADRAMYAAKRSS